MPQVDFYILEDETDSGWLRFACRLADKIWSGGHRLLIHSDDGRLLRHLDELLWTYVDGSFLPHEWWRPELPSTVAPVLLSDSLPEVAGRDVLMNLAATVPEAVAEFARVVEIVGGPAARRTQSRDRFRRYRELGHMPNSHKIA